MKKTLYLIGLALCFYHNNTPATGQQQNKGSYIINLTGKTLVLNFYAKNPLTGKKTWVDIQSVPTLIFGGKNPDTFLDGLNATLLPAPIDMHPITCYQMTFDASNTDASRFSSADNFFKKYKDKSIQGVTVPTPPADLVPHDYKIELKNKQIVVTRLNSRMLVPIPGTKQSDLQQWPSAESIKIAMMSAPEKLAYYQQNNLDLQNSIKQLDEEIKKYSKAAAITKMNNRKKMKTNKEEEIKKNNKRIAALEKEIATNQAPSQKATSTGKDTANKDLAPNA